MIGVISALEAEAAGVAQALREEAPVREEVRCGRPLTYGTLAGQDTVLAISGIGKVAAAMTAALLAPQVNTVLVVGTAGGLGHGVEPGDVIVATALLQHDLDARPLFARWQQPDSGVSRFPTAPHLTWALLAAADDVVAGPNLGAPLGLGQPRRQAGLVISGDAFVGSHDVAGRLRRDLPDALAVDMESAAVAQVCAAADIPLGVIRVISDRANGQASVDFARFLAQVAGPIGRDLVVQTLRRLGG
jgi:adenosylhomocysteine nucleosidase